MFITILNRNYEEKIPKCVFWTYVRKLQDAAFDYFENSLKITCRGSIFSKSNNIIFTEYCRGSLLECYEFMKSNL